MQPDADGRLARRSLPVLMVLAMWVVGGTAAADPSITIAGVTRAETHSGTTEFDFTISLSASSTETVTVDWATADNTAVAPDDAGIRVERVVLERRQQFQTVARVEAEQFATLRRDACIGIIGRKGAQSAPQAELLSDLGARVQVETMCKVIAVLGARSAHLQLLEARAIAELELRIVD